jgi:uncharacterized membrane protein YphA (DoxX/SURF4 family)
MFENFLHALRALLGLPPVASPLGFGDVGVDLIGECAVLSPTGSLPAPVPLRTRVRIHIVILVVTVAAMIALLALGLQAPAAALALLYTGVVAAVVAERVLVSITRQHREH